MPAVSRRTVLKGAGAVTVGAAAGHLAGCGTGTEGKRRARESERAGVLIVRDSGGSHGAALRRSIYAPFTEETGIRVETVHFLHGQMLDQIKRGDPRFDVMDIDMHVLEWFQQNDASQEIDYDRLKNAKDVGIADFLLTSYGVGKSYWASVMGYHADAFGGRRPESWADFWDTKAFPGPRSLQSSFDLPELEFALLADGVPMDKLYPLDVDRAFKSLDLIKDSVRTFWNSGDEPGALLVRREVTATSGWQGRLEDRVRHGAPIRYEWNSARRRANGYGIPKGSGNPDDAYRLIDYALRPQVQARYAEAFITGPVTPAAYAYVPRSIAADLPSSPGNLFVGFDLDTEWWLENMDEVTKRWQEWART
ncbi:polyamine ABC transporter substrate-binding protein [Streptomyces ossamyceticus]|uniref:polyamine ABC transporter substrate-binding protein n=1 Tax=Streptomyces ossamyceticus TaxID=249581 RepID=UPI000B2353F8|nr:polyamine ABC transporter substrate-binding protein [Streptomyces ossamyceticus]